MSFLATMADDKYSAAIDFVMQPRFLGEMIVRSEAKQVVRIIHHQSSIYKIVPMVKGRDSINFNREIFDDFMGQVRNEVRRVTSSAVSEQLGVGRVDIILDLIENPDSHPEEFEYFDAGPSGVNASDR